MSPNSTHNTNPNRPPNVINHIRSRTQPELLEVHQRVLVNNKRHSKPLKTKTPHPPGKLVDEKQITRRLFHLPTQTTHQILYHHPSPFQIYPSSNLILHHPPSSDQSGRQSFAPPQLTVNWRNLPNSILPNLKIG